MNAPRNPADLMHDALVELRRLRARVQELEAVGAAPIAVCGIGCRFPGGCDSPDAFWQLLSDGIDAVGTPPPGRWTERAEWRGGFLDSVDSFDPLFFGISPREAAAMDPQHRLLLETAWEALEHAAMPPDGLRKSRTGLYLGIATNDYEQLFRAAGASDAYGALGSMRSIAAGRLSFIFGFQGPNLSLDTACSSSLAAVHLAVESLRRNECDLALAGGVNLMLTAASFEALGHLQALAPDGRSKAFDASADGFGRAEGCGIVVLKRTPDALRDRDPILAVIHGSAVNHDGPTSGLTVPSVAAQAAVIQAALARAGIAPDQIDYLEAHGTGTALGDPLEAAAITQVFAPRTSARPLRLGSVKTNIGHAEAAAGIAGLIKAVLALSHEHIPASLHFETPNPHIPWLSFPAEVVKTGIPWPRRTAPRFAGVSAFGLSGTNAHVVVGDAPETPPPSPGSRRLHALTLSARTQPALRELAGRFARHLAQHSDLPPADVCWTANTGRAVFRFRLAVFGSDLAGLHDGLAQFAQGETSPDIVAGDVPPRSLGEEPPVAAGLPIEELARSWVAGAVVDWDAEDRPYAARRLALPTYPWQRERYWIEPAVALEPPGAGPIQQTLDALVSDPELASYWESLETLEEITAQYAIRAFDELGLRLVPGERFTSSGLIERYGIAPNHRRFLERLLAMLVAEGILERDDDTWSVARPAEFRDPAGLRQQALARCPEASVEYELVARCGKHLPEVLRGDVEPLAVLFPGGDTSLLSQLYGEAPFARFMNRAFGEVIDLMLAAKPAAAPLRVLEIGAGTGATTARVLSRLSGRNVQYVFTDVSPHFLKAARERFAGNPVLEYRVFDIERPPGSQNIPEAAFDIVIAANVVHAAAEIRPALAHAQRLLAPRGTLLLMETTAPQRWVDLFAGYTGGWWKFRDLELRPGHPLLSSSAWIDILSQEGLSGVGAIEPMRNGSSLPARPVILLATAPASQPAPVTVSVPSNPADLTETIRREVAAVLGLSPSQWPDDTQGLFDLGLDSLSAIELKARLEQAAGVSLTTSDLFDYPNVRALSEHLAARAGLGTKLQAPAPRPHAEREPVAVIGMACRFPGGAEDPDSFWHLLRNGVDAVSAVPAGRWNASGASPNLGGYLLQVDRFDAEFFGISPREAALLDPQQRLLLETAWEAFESAAWIPERTAGESVGVFLGIATSDYANLVRESGAAGADAGLFGFTGVSNYAAAGRLSYFFGLTGPSLVLDTACSSSLVAVHHAMESVRRGECKMALAGGVNVILSPEGQRALANAHMLSADGRCKSFDAAADGMVRAEGCGLVLLEPLSEALRAGHTVLAVLRGSAVNQDGARSALTVPNGRMQEAVIRRALEDGRTAPGDVAYVEAHGTGTALGDPIEAAALDRVYGEARDGGAVLLIGSVKSNLGHLEAAAGIAALIKTILSVQHGEIPASLHFHTPNPLAKWETLRVRVAAAPTGWPEGKPRLAGVSSFGASGTNAHVIVAEPPAHEATAAGPRRPCVLCLSARTEASLRELARRYIHHLETHPDLDPADVCGTAFYGRAHFRHRLAVAGDDLACLRNRLEGFLSGREAPNVEPDSTATEPWRRVPLPFYAWQRERHWVPQTHPLLGKRLELAGSREVVWETAVSPRDHEFLTAHPAGEAFVFPGSAYCEMALAAARELSSQGPLEIRQFEIERALVFQADSVLSLQVAIQPFEDNRRQFRIYGRTAGDWQLHARGFLSRSSEAIPAECQAGPWLLPPSAVAQVLGALFGPSEPRLPGNGTSLVQVGFDSFTWFRPAPAAPLVRAKWRNTAEETRDLCADLDVSDSDGNPVWTIRGLRFRRVAEASLANLARAPWRDWLYQIEWIPQPLYGAGLGNFQPDAVQSSLARDSAAWPEFSALARYREATALLNRIAAGYLARAFSLMGWTPGASTESVGIAPRHNRLLRRCLEILASQTAAADPEREICRLRAEYPEADAECDLLERCGRALPDLLRGNQEAVPLLFPGGDMSAATRLYTDSAGSRFMNRLLASVLGRIAGSLPQTRGIRILEIGAGTGGTAAGVLPLLDASRTEYVFTDISPLFLSHARERFGRFPFVRFASLDIESSPAPQGFEEGTFDLVLATNVLHATRDVRDSLAHARSLLAPGGCLLLIEGFSHLAWIDLTFGFTEGWWRFGDTDLRPDYPLLDPDGWRVALADAGFVRAQNLAQRGDGAELESALLLAFAPSAEKRNVVFADRIVGPALDGVQVRPGASYRRISESSFEIDPFQPSHYDRLLAEIGPGAADRVVHLWSLDAPPDLPAASEFNCRSALLLMQSLLRLPGRKPSVTFVTQNGQPAGEVVPCPPAAALWGIGKTAALEHPELHVRLLDYDRPSAGGIRQELAAAVPESVSIRHGQRFAARLHRVDLQPRNPGFSSGETCIIAGGSHGIGLDTAEWMIRHGARSLVLLGRSEVPADVRRRIEATGATVRFMTVDVGDETALRQALAGLTDLPPVRGIVHSAGVFEDRLLLDHSWEPFENVFRAKVAGSWNLSRLARELPLRFFAMFSSGASLNGSAGLANYAAANAFQDALAHRLRREGIPSFSINWGAWKDTGMAAAVGARREAQWDADGLRQMDPPQALEALGAVLAGFPGPQIAVVDIDWPRFLDRHQSAPWIPLLDRFRDRVPAARKTAHDGVRAQIQSASPDRRRDILESFLEREVAKLLALPSGALPDHETGFFDLGVDSLLSLELRNRLQAELDQDLPATFAFQHANIAALTDHLAISLGILVPERRSAAAGAEIPDFPPGRIADCSEEELDGFFSQALETLKRSAP